VNFSLSEAQEAVRDLAEQIFTGGAPMERVASIETTDERVDRDLWRALADAGLLGIVVPEDHGGAGLDLIEACLILEQQGRRVAPVPLWPTLVGALALAAHGTPAQQAAHLPGVAAGDVMLTAALAEAGAGDVLEPSVTAVADGDGWRLDGTRPSVPAAHVAGMVLVPARLPSADATDATDTGGAEPTTGVFLVDPGGPGVTCTPAVTTDRSVVAHLELAGAPGEALGGEPDPRVLAWLRDRALLALCALQVGVAEGALRMAADYTSQRHQFGKPLSTFQGVALRAADAYIDTEAMRVTLWQAAWRLTAGLEATREVMVAKWWSAEGGQRVVHATQHLHGGMGADVDYPVHRYFLWGKQLEITLGGASATLARLGRAIAKSRT